MPDTMSSMRRIMHAACVFRTREKGRQETVVDGSGSEETTPTHGNVVGLSKHTTPSPPPKKRPSVLHEILVHPARDRGNASYQARDNPIGMSCVHPRPHNILSSPYLYRCLVRLRLDGVRLPDAEVLHVGHHARGAVDAPRALGLVGVFCLVCDKRRDKLDSIYWPWLGSRCRWADYLTEPSIRNKCKADDAVRDVRCMITPHTHTHSPVFIPLGWGGRP